MVRASQSLQCALGKAARVCLSEIGRNIVRVLSAIDFKTVWQRNLALFFAVIVFVAACEQPLFAKQIEMVAKSYPEYFVENGAIAHKSIEKEPVFLQGQRISDQFSHNEGEQIIGKRLRFTVGRSDDSVGHRIAGGGVRIERWRQAFIFGKQSQQVSQFNKLSGCASVICGAKSNSLKIVPHFIVFSDDARFRDFERNKRSFQLSERSLRDGDGSLHIAGLSDASPPSDNQNAKGREGEQDCGPCQPFRIFGHTFIGASAPAARGGFWGAICGLGALVVIFWIDYLDRHASREDCERKERTQHDFWNAKPAQRKPQPDRSDFV